MSVLPTPKSPLSDRAAEVLAQAIADGRLGAVLPPERTLCQMLGVSRPVLREALQVLERKNVVCRPGRGQSRRTVAEPAPGLRARRFDRVVFLSPLPFHQMSSFALLVLQELRAQLAESGLELVHLDSVAYKRRHPEPVLRQLLAATPQALWLLYRSTRPMQEWFAESGAAVAVLGSTFPGLSLPFVKLDMKALGHHAVNLLLARGHQTGRMVFVTTAPTLAGTAEFLDGAAAAMPAGSPPLEVLSYAPGDPSDFRRRLIRLRANAARPTAYLLQRAEDAITCLSVMHSLGARIPEEASALVLEDDPILDHVYPAMDRYRVSSHGFSQRIARMIVSMQSGGRRDIPGTSLVPEWIHGDTLSIPPAECPSDRAPA
jgi:DNA-binding LacI/PurR family transcriptional regulator